MNTAHIPNPKSGMFSGITDELRHKYAAAVMSDITGDVENALDYGLKIGLTVSEIESDIRDAAGVKKSIAALQAIIDSLDSQKTKDEEAHAKRVARNAAKAVNEAQKALNMANHDVRKIASARSGVRRARSRIEAIQNKNPRLFGQTVKPNPIYIDG